MFFGGDRGIVQGTLTDSYSSRDQRESGGGRMRAPYMISQVCQNSAPVRYGESLEFIVRHCFILSF